jgi:alcohol dehydrogenase class IV
MQQARRDAVDGVVSFGGGSCADLGKAVSYFTEQEAGTPGASCRFDRTSTLTSSAAVSSTGPASPAFT